MFKVVKRVRVAVTVDSGRNAVAKGRSCHWPKYGRYAVRQLDGAKLIRRYGALSYNLQQGGRYKGSPGGMRCDDYVSFKQIGSAGKTGRGELQ